MNRHWAEFGPPAYIALALKWGMTKPGAGRREISEPGDFEADMMAMAPGGSL